MRILILITLISLAFFVGTLFCYGKTENVEWKIKFFNETEEYKLAKKFDGQKFGTCWEFKNFWLEVFPKKPCFRISNKNYQHWYCQVIDNIMIDANWKLDGKVRIFLKK
jgi:hypothetical protein